MEIPNYLVTELDIAITEARNLLNGACADCNDEGQYSLAAGKLTVIGNIIKELMKTNINFKKETPSNG